MHAYPHKIFTGENEQNTGQICLANEAPGLTGPHFLGMPGFLHISKFRPVTGQFYGPSWELGVGVLVMFC